MSRTMHINVCFIRCRCRHRLLIHIWFNKCVILLNRWNSRRILWFCWSHKWMWNHVESLHVIWQTQARHYTDLPYRCNVVTELHPSSIHFLNRNRRRNRIWRNSLDLPKLSYNPIWSVNDRQGTPSEMVEKQGDDLKFSKWIVVTTRNPTHNVRGQSVQTLVIRRHGQCPARGPSACTRSPLVIILGI